MFNRTQYASNSILSNVDIHPLPGLPQICTTTFVKGLQNQVEIVSLGKHVTSQSVAVGLPPTSIQFGCNDLLATSGDGLRIYKYGKDIQCVIHLNNTRRNSLTTGEAAAPFSNMDWNRVDSRRVVTCSLDTTCIVWDINKGTPKTQLIAHDKDVYDVKFVQGGVDQFVTCSLDGSIRMFDSRRLEHSTILYEQDTPLLRVATNDEHFVSTFGDQKVFSLIDLRMPGQAVECLETTSCVTGMRWADSGTLFLSQEDGKILLYRPFSNITAIVSQDDPINGLAVKSQGPNGYWLSYSSKNVLTALIC